MLAPPKRVGRGRRRHALASWRWNSRRASCARSCRSFVNAQPSMSLTVVYRDKRPAAEVRRAARVSPAVEDEPEPRRTDLHGSDPAALEARKSALPSLTLEGHLASFRLFHLHAVGRGRYQEAVSLDAAGLPTTTSTPRSKS